MGRLFGRLQLPNLFKLFRKTMTKWTFMTELIDQQFRLFKSVDGDLGTREKTTKVFLDFCFG